LHTNTDRKQLSKSTRCPLFVTGTPGWVPGIGKEPAYNLDSWISMKENIRSVQKFLLIFCNFFLYNIFLYNKKNRYDINQSNYFSSFSMIFFPSFRNLFSSTAAGRTEHSLSLKFIFKSFKPICTHSHSNDYNIFTIRLTNNSMCISNTFLLTKTKGSLSDTIFNRTKCKIILTSMTCHS